MRKKSLLDIYLQKKGKYGLDYFLEWGGGGWRSLTDYAISSEMTSAGLKDKKVLEIGARYGKVSSLFAILGANVTGIDIDEQTISVAQDETKKHGVSDKVDFLAYNGDLDLFPDESFNLIFTKSVLVVVPELTEFLNKIYAKLKPNGSAIFIENGYGNFAVHTMRRYRHKDWDHGNALFFNDSNKEIFKDIFESVETKKTLYPPVYMFYCKKTS